MHTPQFCDMFSTNAYWSRTPPHHRDPPAIRLAQSTTQAAAQPKQVLVSPNRREASPKNNRLVYWLHIVSISAWLQANPSKPGGCTPDSIAAMTVQTCWRPAIGNCGQRTGAVDRKAGRQGAWEAFCMGLCPVLWVSSVSTVSVYLCVKACR